MKQFSALQFRLAISGKRLCGCVAVVTVLSAAAIVVTPGVGYAKAGTSDFILPAAVTNLTALPDSTIAVITGTGLKAPSINGAGEPRATITLWDELRPAVQQNSLSNSNSTITVNGVVQ
ncbi:hypothetical protein [Acidocella aquatica]|uniref:hypothetical protein n=1 Tax=Acidocella aquatica TaxID=1922313 RepID=UPI0024E17130|nr:hypothetical protein [Acidocella aquatica]